MFTASQDGNPAPSCSGVASQGQGVAPPVCSAIFATPTASGAMSTRARPSPASEPPSPHPCSHRCPHGSRTAGTKMFPVPIPRTAFPERGRRSLAPGPAAALARCGNTSAVHSSRRRREAFQEETPREKPRTPRCQRSGARPGGESSPSRRLGGT